MPIQVDMTGVSSEGFPALESGDYPAIITECKEAKSQANKPKLAVVFTLKDQNNRKAFKDYSLQPQALWGLKQDLGKLGIDVPDGPFELDEQELLNMEVIVTLEKVPHYQGKTDENGDPVWQNDVTGVRADDGSTGGW